MSDPARIKIRLEDGRVGTVDRAEWESGADELASFQPLEQQPAPAPSQPQQPGFFEPGGPAEAFGRKALQMMGFGMADELAGAEQAALNRRLSDTVDPYGGPMGNPDALQRLMDLGQPRMPQIGRGIAGQPLSAQQMTQQLRGQYSQLAQDNPRADLAGTAVGGAVQAGALPLAAPKGATLGTRLAQAAEMGAPLGAAHGLGNADTGDPASMVAQTAVGAAGGALGGVAGQGVGEGISAAANRLAQSEVGQALARWASEKAGEFGDKAARLRVRAGGARYAKDANKIEAQPGGLEAQGRDMLEMGIGTGKPKLGSQDLAPGSSPKLMLQRVEQYLADAQQVKQAAGQQMEWVRNDLTKNGVTVSGQRIGEALLDEAASLSELPGQQARSDALVSLADQWEQMGEVPFEQAHRALQEFGKGTRFASESLANEDKRLVYTTVRRAMQESADTADPAIGKAWREGTRAYQVAKGQSDAAENWIEGQSRNRQTSLTDYLASGAVGGGMIGAGASPGEAILAAGATRLANKAIRGREHALGAGMAQSAADAFQGFAGAVSNASRTASGAAVAGAEAASAMTLPQRVRQLVDNNPAELGPYGHVLRADPENFATNFALLSQTDADFQKRLRELEKKEQENEQ